MPGSYEPMCSKNLRSIANKPPAMVGLLLTVEKMKRMRMKGKRTRKKQKKKKIEKDIKRKNEKVRKMKKME